jgi:hypothetical protein
MYHLSKEMVIIIIALYQFLIIIIRIKNKDNHDDYKKEKFYIYCNADIFDVALFLFFKRE